MVERADIFTARLSLLTSALADVEKLLIIPRDSTL
jgi:hypothetical protein